MTGTTGIQFIKLCFLYQNITEATTTTVDIEHEITSLDFDAAQALICDINKQLIQLQVCFYTLSDFFSLQYRQSVELPPFDIREREKKDKLLLAPFELREKDKLQLSPLACKVSVLEINFQFRFWRLIFW